MLKCQGNHDLVITIWSCYDMLMITWFFVCFFSLFFVFFRGSTFAFLFINLYYP